MELKELIGLKKLSGVSNENIRLDQRWEDDENFDASSISFILNGTTYTATEDHNDGYRSAMGELSIDKYQCKNIFEPIDVLCIYKSTSGSYNNCDILQMYGMNGELLLEVGTDNDDDYYPSFVSYFKPENIPVG